MKDWYQTLLCIKRLKKLKRYDLLPQATSLITRDAAKLAEDLWPIRPRTLLDGGFHKGWFSRTLSFIYKDLEICGCDPIKHDFCDRLFEEHSFHFFHTALGDKSGFDELHLVNDSQLHSLLPFDETYKSTFGVTYEPLHETKVVEISTIDTIMFQLGWTSCDLLKLDLQGGELSALKGATQSLKTIKAVYLEVSFEPIYKDQSVFSEIDEFLREKNFKLSKILNPRGGNYLLQSDALYLNLSYYPLC